MYWSITFIPLLRTYAEFGRRTLVGGVNYANCLSWRSCGESPPIGYAEDDSAGLQRLVSGSLDQKITRLPNDPLK
jgi:hypothetical protein